LYAYGAKGKLQRYAGLKEEYYLADFEPDPAIVNELGLDASQPVAVVRTPPSVSLYHRFENDLFAQVLLALREQAQVVVLPRVADQRAELERAGGFIVPERAIDAQSLIALSDVVVSAGGTMNREAVALGTPVFTTFEGRLGAVDERLIAEGRMRKLESAAEVSVVKRTGDAAGERIRRDPRDLLALVLAPLHATAGV
jgi:predicted glycosyltransferase